MMMRNRDDDILLKGQSVIKVFTLQYVSIDLSSSSAFHRSLSLSDSIDIIDQDDQDVARREDMRMSITSYFTLLQ